MVVKLTTSSSLVKDLWVSFKRIQLYGFKINPLKCAFDVYIENLLSIKEALRLIKTKPLKDYFFTIRKNYNVFFYIKKVNFLKWFFSNMVQKSWMLFILLKLK
jgi:hypothetical protein